MRGEVSCFLFTRLTHACLFGSRLPQCSTNVRHEMTWLDLEWWVWNMAKSDLIWSDRQRQITWNNVRRYRKTTTSISWYKVSAKRLQRFVFLSVLELSACGFSSDRRKHQHVKLKNIIDLNQTVVSLATALMGTRETKQGINTALSWSKIYFSLNLQLINCLIMDTVDLAFGLVVQWEYRPWMGITVSMFLTDNPLFRCGSQLLQTWA